MWGGVFIYTFNYLVSPLEMEDLSPIVMVDAAGNNVIV
jgi:hypothetical protein